MVVDDEEKSNILNTFFSTVFTVENEMLGEIPRNDENTILRVTNLTQEEVRNRLNKIKIDKSPGPDGIHPRVLRELSNVIDKPLFLIFSDSIATGSVPQDWRIANVVPIFKKGSKSEPGNYRPMTSAYDVLRFQLPGHEAATMRSMNQLRTEERFCDVTVLADGLKFRGHRVVLAACSPFPQRSVPSESWLGTPSFPHAWTKGGVGPSTILLHWTPGILSPGYCELPNGGQLSADGTRMEKCRQALTQFIDPQIGLRDPKSMASRGATSTTTTSTMRPLRPAENSKTVKADESEEEMLMMGEDEDDEEEEEESPADLCIVKVEAGGGGGAGGKVERSWRNGREERNSVAQPEEALVNSTVEGETVDGAVQQGVMKAIYSDEVEGGEGVLIIPSSYHEEEDEILDGGVGGCQSSVVIDGSSRGSLGGPGGSSSLGAMVIGDARFGNRRLLRCTKCEETFQGVEKLVFHMRAQHFVFMCPRCGKQFNHSSNLNRHMNVHRGVKSHTCTICGKCFTQKSTLHDHLNLHSGERPYRCSYCDVRFAHKPAIRRHLKEQHGKTTAQNVLEAGAVEMNISTHNALESLAPDMNLMMG
ncbi:unnamed protein product [Ranitomeya imitator]|uniref:Zinc finger and BTB domain-containing protein 12 n=1 Tax=Ranitomeya imitator TaxID=111125 RepID=A0ABN9LSM8_9NEOB|nr:unnamed protein product [Ranitomeya imitator]